jgi:sodium/hydrogen antiporter
VLSLTIVRMLPVAVAMIGTGARPPTLGFPGWFGPHPNGLNVDARVAQSESNGRSQ